MTSKGKKKLKSKDKKIVKQVLMSEEMNFKLLLVVLITITASSSMSQGNLIYHNYNKLGKNKLCLYRL